MIYDSDIEELFYTHFQLGTENDYIQVNSHTGEITVFGSVSSLFSDISRLPVMFGEVSGNFKIDNFHKLETLEGCPKKVSGYFTVFDTLITTLEGGPEFVGKQYNVPNNNLKTLQGIAKKVGGLGLEVTRNPLKTLEGLHDGIPEVSLDYDPNLPVLRLLLVNHSMLLDEYEDPTSRRKQPGYQVDKILQKYRGQGAAGVLRCASELTEMGFENNAEW